MSTSDKVTRRLPNQVLQEERLQRGWTQQEVANRVGTTVINVSRWERGITSPNPYFRQKLCALFEKDAEALGLFPVKQIPQSEISQASEEVTPDLPEKKLAATSNEIASLSLRNRLLGERKPILAVSIALVILVSGSGFLIHSFLFSQPGYITPTLVNGAIGKDAFQRANQTYWGTAADGQRWTGDANALENFSIANNAARITMGTERVYNALLGSETSDAEVLFSGSLSDFNNSNLGAVLRWQDTDHWYKAYIDGTRLVIQKKEDAGNPTYLISVAFKVHEGYLYTIRFRAVGEHLSAKVWPTVNREPDGWMATTLDSSFTEGFCGLRIQVQNNATATVTSFQAMPAS